MDSKNYWQLFLETGAPELYLMYSNALKMEETHVPERSGAGAEGHGLQ
ncbi:MAG: hypothetical protein IJW14_01155 [Oscillospiraceae bacterium]|nr:hypothetical protein [Oscillospiraceae bacterium]